MVRSMMIPTTRNSNSSHSFAFSSLLVPSQRDPDLASVSGVERKSLPHGSAKALGVPLWPSPRIWHGRRHRFFLFGCGERIG